MPQRTPTQLPAHISPEALALMARRFKALGDAARLRLIVALESGERNVSDLVETTGASQANVSRQLQQLCDARIVSRRKEGARVFYAICDPMILDLCAHVCGNLHADLQRQADAARTLARSPRPRKR